MEDFDDPDCWPSVGCMLLHGTGRMCLFHSEYTTMQYSICRSNYDMGYEIVARFCACTNSSAVQTTVIRKKKRELL